MPNYQKQNGIINIGIAMLLITVFAFTILTSYSVTDRVQTGQVRSATNTRGTTSVVDWVADRVRSAVSSSTNTTTAPRPEPGSDIIPVEDVVIQQYTGIQPFKGAPMCTDHNDTDYHGVWNDEKGCFYDHTHGADPSKTIFSGIVKEWDQEISYPWQTPNENLYKHKGYFYIYDEAKNGCELFKNSPELKTEEFSCITHILYGVHSIGTTAELTTRYHSYRVVARVCDQQDMTKCGFVQTGGWADYGTLHCPYKKTHCPLSNDPLPLATDGGKLPDTVAINQPPYRTIIPKSLIDRSLKNNSVIQFWNNLGPNPIDFPYYPDRYNVIFGSAWTFDDAWGYIDPADSSLQLFVCEKGDCKHNHTAVQLFTARFLNLPKGPFNGFTDRRGNIVNDCSVGLDCVPFIVDAGVPEGTAFFNRAVRQGDPSASTIYEYDICFNNKNERTNCRGNNDVTVGVITPQAMPAGMKM